MLTRNTVISATLFMLSATSAFAQVPMIAYPSSSEPYCREYTQTIKIGKAVQKAYGTACRQPDGSWQLMPAGGQAGAQPAPAINYVVRDDRVYYMPPYPAFDVEIFGHYRHGEKHGGYWHGGHHR